MKLNIVLLVLILLFSSCIEKFATHRYGFRLYNNSNKRIEAYADFIYPDTIMCDIKPELNILDPSRSTLLYDDDKSEESLNRFFENGERITLFIFSTDTLNKYSWDQIRLDYNILKRYEITKQELDDMGGELVYP